MTDAMSLLEQRLAKAYADQAAHYDRALRVMGKPQSAADQDAESESWVHEFQAALTEVAAIDASIADDKSVWLQSGRVPSEPLRSILDKLAQRIRSLAEMVDRRVAALSAKRQQLMPELDGFIRQRRMLHVYGQYAKSRDNA